MDQLPSAAAEGPEGNERRIQRILTRARHDTGARDLLVFGGARLWLSLVSLGGVLFAALTRRRRSDPESTAKGVR